MKLSQFTPAQVQPQSDMQVCIRQGRLNGRMVQHCYVRLVGESGDIEDSLSYGPGEPGTADKKPGSAQQCSMVLRNIQPAMWEKVRRHYRHYDQEKDFFLREHDCCTCAGEAIRLTGSAVPGFIREANRSVAG